VLYPQSSHTTSLAENRESLPTETSVLTMPRRQLLLKFKNYSCFYLVIYFKWQARGPRQHDKWYRTIVVVFVKQKIALMHNKCLLKTSVTSVRVLTYIAAESKTSNTHYKEHTQQTI